MKTTIKKIICFTITSLFVMTQAQADIRDYYVGDYLAKGTDTSLNENYTYKINIKKNEGHFLKMEIETENSGTYYGYISKVGKKRMKIDYYNTGHQKHTVYCKVANDAGNFAKFTCKGSLTGNVGGDGQFIIANSWHFDK